MTSFLTLLARRAAAPLFLAGAGFVLAGCSVIAVADTAATIAVDGAGLAVDAAVGTARLAGKAAGAAVDVVLPSSH